MPSEARTAKRRTRVGDAFGVARAAWQADRHRKTGIRRHRAETEFLPAALEVLESPASPTARYPFWALVAFLLVAIGWSFVGELAVVALASGRTIPTVKDRKNDVQGKDVSIQLNLGGTRTRK